MEDRIRKINEQLSNPETVGRRALERELVYLLRKVGGKENIAWAIDIERTW